MINGLGDRLRASREKMRLSQKEVASAIGVSPGTISNYEKNERVPSLESLVSLSNLYNCSTDFLLGFKETERDRFIDVSMLAPDQRSMLITFLESLKQSAP